MSSSKNKGGDSHPHGAYLRLSMCGDNLSSAVELKKDVTIVVLGASGDLAKKKTVTFLSLNILMVQFPALFGLVSCQGEGD